MVKKIREFWKLKTRKEKFILTSVMSLMLVGLVSGIWYLTHTTNPSGFVVDGGVPIQFQSNFGMIPIDVANASFEGIEYINISNNNGNLNYSIGINTTIVDFVGDNCDDYLGDSTILVKHESTELDDGDSFIISNGDSQVSVSTTMQRLSCKQNVSTIIELTPNTN